MASVITDSHCQGILSPKTIQALKNTQVNCLVNSGGVVVIKPLLVHSSLSALEQNRRRVIPGRICRRKFAKQIRMASTTSHFSRYPATILIGPV